MSSCLCQPSFFKKCNWNRDVINSAEQVLMTGYSARRIPASIKAFFKSKALVQVCNIITVVLVMSPNWPAMALGCFWNKVQRGEDSFFILHDLVEELHTIFFYRHWQLRWWCRPFCHALAVKAMRYRSHSNSLAHSSQHAGRNGIISRLGF